jgi:hypothetical protein
VEQCQEDRSRCAFEQVWTPANDGTCCLVETLVERRKVVHEETTMTTVGTNAVAVTLTTKEKIKDRLRQKYITAQKINKQEYNDNPPYDCWSNEGKEKMMKDLDLSSTPTAAYLHTSIPLIW